MKAIEIETVIPPDGRLPSSFQEVFGRKARIIVLFQEDAADTERKDAAARWMALAGKITAFRDIDDPVAHQKKYRDEWVREWDK